jgi:hypothetical protein
MGIDTWRDRWQWGAENHFAVVFTAVFVVGSVVISLYQTRRKIHFFGATDGRNGATVDPWQTTNDLVRATIALYGSGFYWVGTWNLCLHSLYDDNGKVVQDEALWGREIGSFFFVGLWLALVTDTLYTMGGIEPRACVGSDSYIPSAWTENVWVMRARIAGGIVGTILIWLGIYMGVGHFVWADSEDLFQYSGVFQEPLASPSFPLPGVCIGIASALCPGENGLKVGSRACAACMLEQWDSISGDPLCKQALADGNGSEHYKQYQDSAVFDLVVAYCREQIPTPRAPPGYFIKDVIVFTVGMLLLHIAGTFYDVGLSGTLEPRTWFMKPLNKDFTKDSMSEDEVEFTKDLFSDAGRDTTKELLPQSGLLQQDSVSKVATRCSGDTTAGSWQLHAQHLLRALVSLSGQAFMWQSWWDILEFYEQGTIYRELSFVLFGLLVFTVSHRFTHAVVLILLCTVLCCW